MKISSNAARNLAILAAVTAQGLMTGCTVLDTAGMVQADSGTIDFCYKRGTHTQCFEESAEAYADAMQAYQEQAEIAEFERSGDW